MLDSPSQRWYFSHGLGEIKQEQCLYRKEWVWSEPYGKQVFRIFKNYLLCTLFRSVLSGSCGYPKAFPTLGCISNPQKLLGCSDKLCGKMWPHKVSEKMQLFYLQGPIPIHSIITSQWCFHGAFAILFWWVQHLWISSLHWKKSPVCEFFLSLWISHSAGRWPGFHSRLWAGSSGTELQILTPIHSGEGNCIHIHSRVRSDSS